VKSSDGRVTVLVADSVEPKPSKLHVIVALLSTKTRTTNTRLDRRFANLPIPSHHARSTRDNETQVSQTPR
jgi:hypothetical protein